MKAIGRGVALAAPLLVLLQMGGCTAEPTSQAPPQAGGGGAPATSGGGPAASHPPVVRSARVFPVDVNLDATLRVDVQSEDAGGGQTTYRYQWIVNDSPVSGATQPEFTVEQLKKGDRIKVAVTPNDGTVDGLVYVSEHVTVGNTAPTIAEIQLEPSPVRRGEPLKARVVAGDAEGDPITLSYKWFRNGKEIPGATAGTLETKDLRKKDVVMVLATASDGKASREGLLSYPVTVENAPPSFTSVPPAEFKEGQYLYAVVVVDPDEDPVTLELKQGPPGMTLDAATRQIVWKLTPQSVGKHHIVIAAKDTDNAVTQQEFDLDAQLPPQAAESK